MAGMGGQMAEQKKRASVRTAGKKAVRKPTISAPEQNQALEAEKMAKAIEEQAEASIDTFRSAAQDELRKSGQEIAQKLREKSVQGDTKSTKLLIELATKPSAKKVAKAESVALKIAADPEWNGKAKKKANAVTQGKEQ